MRTSLLVRRGVLGVALASLCTLLPVAHGMAATPSATPADSLYVGDASDNTVKRFDANTAGFLEDFVKSGEGGLDGPRGLVFSRGSLFVVSQNVTQDNPGDILRYSGRDGSFQGVLQTSPNRPAAPRGMIVVDGHVIVASPTCDPLDGAGTKPGRLQEFDAVTGRLVAQYGPSCSLTSSTFHPRGVVLGPDGYLYVSNDPNGPTGTGGQVLRFNPNPRKLVSGPVDRKPFVDCTANCTLDLNRPEGLVFNPAGSELYVTSFKDQNNLATSNDKILIFGRAGQRRGRIDLDSAGATATRAFAQALLFGPSGRLYVPISNLGEVWRYNVATNPATKSTVIPAGTVAAPLYLSFGQTNPATLAYGRP